MIQSGLFLSGSHGRRTPGARAGWLVGIVVALAHVAACGSSGKAGAGGAGTAGMTSSVDKSRCDERGKQVITADTNGDQRADVLKVYGKGVQNGESTQVLVCKQVDLNSDGKMDIVYHYGDDSALTFEEFDLDFDGRFDLRAFYQNGRKVREELDTNYDQKVDFTKYYEADRLVRVERDSNNDGRVDEWQYYEAGKLDRIGFDSSGSGRVDRWERAPEDPGATAEAPASAPAGAAASPPPATTPPASPASTTPPPPN